MVKEFGTFSKFGFKKKLKSFYFLSLMLLYNMLKMLILDRGFRYVKFTFRVSY